MSFLDFHEKEIKEVEGAWEFLNNLSIGDKIEFDDIFNEEKYIIEIVNMTEFGKDKFIPQGAIFYAKLNDEGKHIDLHKDGYYPCQTFLSMSSWIKNCKNYKKI